MKLLSLKKNNLKKNSKLLLKKLIKRLICATCVKQKKKQSGNEMS